MWLYKKWLEIKVCTKATIFNMFGDNIVRFVDSVIIDIENQCDGKWKWRIIDEAAPWIVDSHPFDTKEDCIQDAHKTADEFTKRRDTKKGKQSNVN